MNNKGFTLVELLAALAILAILMGVALPNILAIVEKSRNKMYITDAKKFVSTVEYQVTAGKIAKPNRGSSKKITLATIDSSEYNNPPNGGTYVKNKSYVKITNDSSGNLSYSVVLIEHMKKGGYKGLLTETSTSVLEGSKPYEKVKTTDKLT